MRFVDASDVRGWLGEARTLAEMTQTIGHTPRDPDYVEDVLGLPLHVQHAIEHLVAEDPEATPAALQSLPFYSLCRGLFLPMSGMSQEKAAYAFGLKTEPPLGSADREALLKTFLAKDIGLDLTQKLCCVLGDPFRGRPGTLRRDSLLTVLQSVQLTTRRELLDRLARVGDVAVLYAESRKTLRHDPPLTAAEVLEALRFLPAAKRNKKLALVRSLLARCGKLEAYFLAKLVLRKAGFGFEYQGPLLARALGDAFGANPEAVAHGIALSDTFEVVRLLSEQGPEGLRSLRLQPLVPVRPALAAGTVADLRQFPVWVERKYDGIRLVLHKSSDRTGAVLCGAYTRNRMDWLEMIRGLDASIRALPAHSAIVDGELHGTVIRADGPRPATVYEVYAALQGQASRPVNLKFAAFDLLYLNGQDITSAPLHQRRQQLAQLVGPLGAWPLPVPIALSEGQLAQQMPDVNRLYQHFRAQGYEGVIAKDPNGRYLLSQRDPSWLKKKPAVTLDLVLIGGVFAVTEKKTAGMFGSYVIAARTKDHDFVDVGDVAGVDVERDAEIQQEIAREGLITGRRIVRKSMSGERPGIELRPHLVATIRFEGVIKDPETGEHKLRGPKLVHMRSDKGPYETDTVKDLEELYLRQRMA